MSLLDALHFRALDAEFNAISILDTYDSMIWKESYSEVGDFEIHGSYNKQLLEVAQTAKYIFNSISSRLMVVEKHKIEMVDEEGLKLTITGRSFESFLDRRVLYKSITILNPTATKVSQIICDLVTLSFLSTEYPERYWDPEKVGATLEVVNQATGTSTPMLPANTPLQFTMGMNLLEIVLDLCRGFNLGFRCTYEHTDKVITFNIYEGVDRITPGENQLVLSDQYDNLLTLVDEESIANIRNTALVVGNAVDAKEEPLYPVTVGYDGVTGLDRREIFYKADQDKFIYYASGLQVPMTVEEYQTALSRAGTNVLSNVAYQTDKFYTGEIIETNVCQYKTDFELGDMVVFQALMDVFANARLNAVTFSDDSANGKTLSPSFEYVSTPTVEVVTPPLLFDLVFEDNFTAPNTTSLNVHNDGAWLIIQGTATVAGTNQFYTGAANTVVRCNRVGEVSNFKMSANVENVSRNLVFGIKGPGVYFFTSYKTTAPQEIYIWKVTDGTIPGTPIATGSIPSAISSGAGDTTIQVANGICQVYVPTLSDGLAKVIEIDLSGYGYTGGYIGLGGNAGAYSDDFKAYLPRY